MTNCRDCKHWDSARLRGNTATCDRLNDTNDEDEVHISHNGEFALLRTPPDFGCVLGEAKVMRASDYTLRLVNAASRIILEHEEMLCAAFYEKFGSAHLCSKPDGAGSLAWCVESDQQQEIPRELWMEKSLEYGARCAIPPEDCAVAVTFGPMLTIGFVKRERESNE